MEYIHRLCGDRILNFKLLACKKNCVARENNV